jgi:UDP-N-acetylglucosamine--N-acetylmuramyl-(pentapeptide) pyrophosphoryl-undecaprenol N-acetylglucosamine transferase
VAAYLEDMPRYFARADLLVSRAGATTAAEIIAARKAAILIPFAGASEDHQTLNARELEAVGGAEVLLESRLTPGFLAQRILHYLEAPGDLETMERNLDSLATPNAAADIARLCLDLIATSPRETHP